LIKFKSTERKSLNFDQINQELSQSSEVKETAFESFVKNMNSDTKLIESSAKTAIMFFLKGSFNEIIDEKNINPVPNDLKIEKKLFSSV